jgi:penicillin V acylase-like amidase (Ntn superfamily)
MIYQPQRYTASILTMGLVLLVPTTGRPCTTFVLRGDHRLYFGRNLDWNWEDGLVIINPRGVTKTAWVETRQEPARWTSKYASVTFNQFGQERPFGGMNEAGLVVEQMMLGETVYPAPDSRPAVELLQWIQYQLDLCRSTAEVVATERVIRIERPTTHPARIHYLVCDAGGDCVTIEWLSGKLICHRAGDLPFAVLANDTYANSVAFVRSRGLPSSAESAPTDTNSLARFRWAAGRSAAYRPKTAEQDLDYAFETLAQVAQGRGTVWSIVYDPRSLEIHYCTRSQRQRRTLDFASLKLGGRRSVQFVDMRMQGMDAGNLNWQDLTEARHRAYLEAFLGQETLKRGFADLTPTIEPMLRTLRRYAAP